MVGTAKLFVGKKITFTPIFYNKNLKKIIDFSNYMNFIDNILQFKICDYSKLTVLSLVKSKDD